VAGQRLSQLRCNTDFGEVRDERRSQSVEVSHSTLFILIPQEGRLLATGKLPRRRRFIEPGRPGLLQVFPQHFGRAFSRHVQQRRSRPKSPLRRDPISDQSRQVSPKRNGILPPPLGVRRLNAKHRRIRIEVEKTAQDGRDLVLPKARVCGQNVQDGTVCTWYTLARWAVARGSQQPVEFCGRKRTSRMTSVRLNVQLRKANQWVVVRASVPDQPTREHLDGSQVVVARASALSFSTQVGQEALHDARRNVGQKGELLGCQNSFYPFDSLVDMPRAIASIVEILLEFPQVLG
jgi:hypothetical protein